MSTIDTTIPDFLKVENRGKPIPFVWSYSSLNCYDDVCPYQFFRRYINKDIKFVESPEAAFGNAVHTAFEYRVGGQKPLPENMRQWESFAAPLDGRGAQVEMKMGVTISGQATDFFGKDVWGRGKVDVVLVNGTTAYLPDWKSGKPRENPFELEVNAVLVHAKYPQLKTIKGNYVWLKENRAGPVYDLSDTAGTWQKICGIAKRIEHSKQTTQWEKKRGPLCAWCDCLDCENNTKAERLAREGK